MRTSAFRDRRGFSDTKLGVTDLAFEGERAQPFSRSTRDESQGTGIMVAQHGSSEPLDCARSNPGEECEPVRWESWAGDGHPSDAVVGADDWHSVLAAAVSADPTRILSDRPPALRQEDLWHTDLQVP